MRYPLDVISHYGYKFLDRDWKGRLHPGVDLNSAPGNQDLGTPIKCIADGVVRFTGYNYKAGWGGCVSIFHKQYGVWSLYFHVEKIRVKAGQVVREGEKIAEMGNCKGLYTAHLHFEIRHRPIGNVWFYPPKHWKVNDVLKYYTDPIKFIEAHKKEKKEVEKIVNLKEVDRLLEIAINNIIEARKRLK